MPTPAQDALRDHVNEGATLYLSNKPSWNARGLLGIALVASSFLAGPIAQAQQATPDIGNLTPVASAPLTPWDLDNLTPAAQAIQRHWAQDQQAAKQTVWNAEQLASAATSDAKIWDIDTPIPTKIWDLDQLKANPQVLDIHPDAPATPENMRQLYKTIEAAINAQYPELGGRVTVFDRTADVQTESARIMGKIGNDVALNAILGSVGGDGGTAENHVDAKGLSCVVIGRSAKDSPTMGKQASVIVHEFTHCFHGMNTELARALDKTTNDPYYAEVFNNNAESAASLGAAIWEAKSGLVTKGTIGSWVSVTEFDSSSSSDHRYTIDSAHFDAHAKYVNQVPETKATKLDFSTMREAINEGIAIQDDHLTDVNTLVRIQANNNIRNALYKAADQSTETHADFQKALDKFTQDNRDIPMLGRLSDAFIYNKALADDTALPVIGKDVFANGPVKEPLDMTYAKAVERFQGSEDPLAQAFTQALSKELADQKIILSGAVAFSESNDGSQAADATELTLRTHIERIAANADYRAQVIAGDSSFGDIVPEKSELFADSTALVQNRLAEVAQQAPAHAANDMLGKIDNLAQHAERDERQKVRAATLVIGDESSMPGAVSKAQAYLQTWLLANGQTDMARDLVDRTQPQTAQKPRNVASAER